MMKRNLILVVMAGVAGLLVSCKKEKSSTTGWNYNDSKWGGFEKLPYQEQETGPNLVYIPGGTFTMGLFEQDVLFEADALPRRVTISDFYMDETEVSNVDYKEYLYWLQRVYVDYPEVGEQAKPDTNAWRMRLAYNEPYVKYYFRHPAYDNYPVVGVSWVQATNYAQWRTDRVNEMIMIREGFLKPDPTQTNEENFNTEAYFVDQFEGAVTKKQKKNLGPAGGTRKLRLEDGVLLPDYRLPTEAEWEYAALALQGNAKFENVNDRRIYPWDGLSLRRSEGRHVGKFQANFKRGRGDYQGISEMPNDGSYLTQAVRSYWPNDFGLYNMGGNVSEWVLDVYRPLTSQDASDYNTFRGNVFMKVLRDEDGYIAPKDSLGRLQYIEVTEEENANRRNYKKSDNIGYEDELDYSSGLQGYNLDDGQLYTFISNDARVYKGGSWADRAYFTAPGTRRFMDQNMSSATIGFRCAMVRVGPAPGK